LIAVRALPTIGERALFCGVLVDGIGMSIGIVIVGGVLPPVVVPPLPPLPPPVPPVPVPPVPVPVVPVLVVVVGSPTCTVPVMKECSSQWNL
jgi:hypothetical protein